MPIIPLLKKTGPIANAPAAVLDTQRRPNVDNRSVQQAVGELANSSKVKDVRASDFTGPTEALGAVGEAISKAGNVLGALAIKQREAETDIQVEQADQTMRDAFSEHAAWRTETPDPTQWEDNLNQALAKGRKAVESNEKLHPEARRLIALRMDRFEGDSRTELRMARAMRTFKQADSVYEAGIQRKVLVKDYDGAHDLSVTAEKKGYRYPHQTAALETDIAKSKERDAMEAAKEEREALRMNKYTAIDADPHTADLSDVPDPILKDQLEGHRREVISRRRTDMANQVADGIAGGAINTEADIKALASPDFTDADQKKWKDVLKANSNEAEKEKMRANGESNAALLDADIRAWDPEQDKDGSQRRQFIQRRLMLPVGYREDIRDLMERKRKQAEPDPDHIIKDQGEQQIADLLRTGHFGQYKIIPTGIPEKDAEAEKQMAVQRSQAGWKAAAYRRAWLKELRANPKMTPKEAQAAMSRITAMPIDDAAFTPPGPHSDLLDVGRDPTPIWNEKLGPYAADPNNDLPTGSKPQKSLIEMAPQ